MPFGEVPLATNSSNFPSISPHTLVIANAMVIVVKRLQHAYTKIVNYVFGMKR